MKAVYFAILIFSTSAFSQVGRFTMIKFGDSTMNSVLLDTSTGKMWKHRCVSQTDDKSCKGYVWAEDDILDINVKYKDIAKRYNLDQGK